MANKEFKSRYVTLHLGALAAIVKSESNFMSEYISGKSHPSSIAKGAFGIKPETKKWANENLRKYLTPDDVRLCQNVVKYKSSKVFQEDIVITYCLLKYYSYLFKKHIKKEKSTALCLKVAGLYFMHPSTAKEVVVALDRDHFFDTESVNVKVVAATFLTRLASKLENVRLDLPAYEKSVLTKVWNGAEFPDIKNTEKFLLLDADHGKINARRGIISR